MALPAFIKTWQFNNNQSISGATTDENGQRVMFAMVSSLLGFVTLPWVHWGSCDCVTANNDSATNLWTDYSKVHCGTTKSYIVLENPTTGMQVCFWMSHGTVDWYATVVASLNGEFGAPGSGGTGTDGTTTTRPTAGDEIVMLNNLGFIPSSTSTFRVHVQHSTDAECSRVMVHLNNVDVVLMIMDMPSDPIAGFTLPVVGMIFDGTACSTYAKWNDTPRVYTKIGGDTIALYLTCEGAINAMVGEQVSFADDDTGEWPIMPMGLLSLTGAHRGRKGSLYDIWWGSTAAGNGNTYPDDASKVLAQFDHMVFPWDGTTPGMS
jgi:hypothetical protein